MNLAGKPLAFALLAIGGCLITAAGLLVWSTVNLRFGSLALQEAIDKSTAGDARGARSAAEEAVGWLGEHPVAVLAAADLSSPSSADRLVRAAAKGATGNQRSALAAAAALAKGAPVEGFEPSSSDASLISSIAAKDASSFQFSQDTPPHRAVLATWAVTRLHSAWMSGRTDDVAAAAATLLAIAPRHPQAKELELVLATIGGSSQAKILAAASRIEDPKSRTEVARSLLALVPGRPEIQALIPNSTGMSASETALKQRVDAAIGSGMITDTLVAQCLQMGKGEWAELLIGKSSGTAKEALLATQKAADGSGFAAATTRITTPLVNPAYLTFHLTTVDGGIPGGEVVVTIGNDVVPASMIGRYGTLVSIPIKRHGSLPVAVTYRGEAVWSGTLSL